MYLFVDESGLKDNSILFVGVTIHAPKEADECIKKWRQSAKRNSPKFQVKEYKDYYALNRQREKILSEVGKRYFPFWALRIVNYKSHKLSYAASIRELIRLCGLSLINEIILDKVERSSRYMEKHIKSIKEGLDMRDVNIRWGMSEKEKGIQIADALCGAVARKFYERSGPDYFHLVEHLMASSSTTHL